MKANSPKAKELLALLNDTPVGVAFKLPPLIPALDSSEVQAFVVEREENSWTLACYWNGVSIGDLAATVTNLGGGDAILQLEDV